MCEEVYAVGGFVVVGEDHFGNAGLGDEFATLGAGSVGNVEGGGLCRYALACTEGNEILFCVKGEIGCDTIRVFATVVHTSDGAVVTGS